MSSTRLHLVAISVWDYAGGARPRLGQPGKGHLLLGQGIGGSLSHFHGGKTVRMGVVVAATTTLADQCRQQELLAPDCRALVLGRYQTQLEHRVELLAVAATTTAVTLHLQMA